MASIHVQGTIISNRDFPQITLCVNVCHCSLLSRRIGQRIWSDNVLRRADSQQLANQITCDNLKMKINDILPGGKRWSPAFLLLLIVQVHLSISVSTNRFIWSQLQYKCLFGQLKTSCKRSVRKQGGDAERQREQSSSNGRESEFSAAVKESADTSWVPEEAFPPAAGGLTAVLSPCRIITLFTLYWCDGEVCLYAEQGKTKRRFNDSLFPLPPSPHPHYCLNLGALLGIKAGLDALQ